MGIKMLVPEVIERLYKRYKQRRILSASDTELPVEMFKQEKFNRISFCITCMNRLSQLKQTFLKNIRDNEDYPDCEFVIVNYNSKDGLHDWVKENLSEYMANGLVKYYYTPDPSGWHAAHAKNIAHFLSTGDIVCNLDGDNFTGKDFAYYINYLFNQDEKEDLLLNFRKQGYYGTYGRICMKRDSFIKLGGYDEDLHAVGGEDTDLVERGIAYKMKFHSIEIENFLKYIENTNHDRVKNTNLEKSFAYYNKLNKERTQKRILENDLKANSGKIKSVMVYTDMDNATLQEKVYLQ